MRPIRDMTRTDEPFWAPARPSEVNVTMPKALLPGHGAAVTRSAVPGDRFCHPTGDPERMRQRLRQCRLQTASVKMLSSRRIRRPSARASRSGGSLRRQPHETPRPPPRLSIHPDAYLATLRRTCRTGLERQSTDLRPSRSSGCSFRPLESRPCFRLPRRGRGGWKAERLL